jgi:hypothetical protein
MTLPATGQLKFSAVSVELSQTPTTKTNLGAANVRTLAGKASGVIKASDLRGKTAAVGGSYIYCGLSTVAVATQASILALTQYTSTTLPFSFNLTATSGKYQFFARPVSLGLVLFYDNYSSYYGGWDGAHNDMGVTPGPITITINSVSYYVYRTDFAGLGSSSWEAQAY